MTPEEKKKAREVVENLGYTTVLKRITVLSSNEVRTIYKISDVNLECLLTLARKALALEDSGLVEAASDFVSGTFMSDTKIAQSPQRMRLLEALTAFQEAIK